MKNFSEVARELGVSISTVSYVYHDKWLAKGISRKLAEKVLAKFSEERVLPSILGQQLRSGQTKTVGLLLPNLIQPYFLQLISGLEVPLSKEKYMLILGNSPRGVPSLQTEFFEAMAARSVDRILLHPLPTEGLREQIAQVRARKTPIVFVNNHLPDCDVPFVVSDNRWGARQMVSHILASGRRRILFLGTSPRSAVYTDRLAGYHDAYAEAGMKPPANGVFWREHHKVMFPEIVHQRLQGRNRPDAIFFDTLFMCDDVLRMIHRSLGLKHPDDILLCGFDYPVQVLTEPAFEETVLSPLLTVRQDARRMGALAAHLLLYGTTEDVEQRCNFIRPFLSWEKSAATFPEWNSWENMP